jgi:hypothetical protein
MSDEPDFIERSAQISRNWTGEEWGPEQLVQEFHLYGHRKRAEALDQLDDHLRTVDTSNLRKYARLTSLRRQMDDVHHTLRKVGR